MYDPFISGEKLVKTLIAYKKAAHKVLMKLMPMVNFTTNLQAAFCQFPFNERLQNQIAST